MQVLHYVLLAPMQVVQLESHLEHSLLDVFLKEPIGQSATQDLVYKFRNKLLVQESQSVTEGPEHVVQLESQLRH